MKRLGGKRALGALCVGMLVFGSALGASAGTDADAEIVDQTGDANYLHPIPDPDPTTPQASNTAVDLVKIWYTTRYTVVKDRDASGKVVRVRNVPDALLLNIRTAGEKRMGLFLGGYELGFAVPARGPGGCGLSFYLSFDPQDGAVLKNQISGCHAGPAVILPMTSVKQNGAVATYTMPFADAPFLAGITIEPGGTPGGTTASAHLLGNQAADIVVGGRAFTVGSDVPPDVDCAVTPADPGCA